MFCYFGGYPFKPMRTTGKALQNQPLWCDVVYVRDYMTLDRLAPGKLLKLAAILHENYGTFGIPAMALGEYDRKTGSALQPQYLSAVSEA
jgi:hypothetical protein